MTFLIPKYKLVTPRVLFELEVGIIPSHEQQTERCSRISWNCQLFERDDGRVFKTVNYLSETMQGMKFTSKSYSPGHRSKAGVGGGWGGPERGVS